MHITATTVIISIIIITAIPITTDHTVKVYKFHLKKQAQNKDLRIQLLCTTHRGFGSLVTTLCHRIKTNGDLLPPYSLLLFTLR